MKKNILIVDDIHPIFIEQAEAMGYHCDYQPTIKPDEAYTPYCRVMKAW